MFVDFIEINFFIFLFIFLNVLYGKGYIVIGFIILIFLFCFLSFLIVFIVVFDGILNVINIYFVFFI